MNTTTKYVAWVGALLAIVALVKVSTGSGLLGGSVLEVMQTDFVNGLKIAGDLVLSEDTLSTVDGAFSDDLTVGGDATIDGLTFGSGCFATTTTGVLTEAQLLANSCIEIDPTFPQAVLALTLPATSTMTTLIPSVGQCRDWIIDNSDVAAATTTTIVKGAGWDLVGLDATGAGTGADVIDGLEFGRLRACRQTDTDVVGYVQEYIHAD